MTINPVFVNELRQSAFRRRGALVTIGLVAAGLLTTVLASVEGLHAYIVFTPVVVLPLIVPAIASGAFAKEYEQQTWQDLTLTRLTNAQIVWGKFGAYLLLVAASLAAFLPALVLMLLGDYGQRLSYLQSSFVPITDQVVAVGSVLLFYNKLLVSACLYILLTMVCSRYSPNRRTSITWSYIAMGLYTGLGVLLWTMVGALDYQNQALDGSPSAAQEPVGIVMPGFMESFHLLFSSIVGLGSFILIWISLSEQRGYKGGSDSTSSARAWQPMANSPRRANGPAGRPASGAAEG